MCFKHFWVVLFFAYLKQLQKKMKMSNINTKVRYIEKHIEKFTE